MIDPSSPATPVDDASRPMVGQRAGRGYPLSLLFLIVAGAAIVVSQLIPLGPAVLEERVPVLSIVACSIGFGVICLILGTLIGSMSSRRFIGALRGGLVGALTGPVIGPLALVPRDALNRNLWSAIGGCILIIGLAAVARIMQLPVESSDEVAEPGQSPDNGS